MKRNEKSRFGSWWIHILFIILFISFPIITGPRGLNEILRWPPGPFVIRDLVQFSLLTGLFYFNYFLLVPALFFKGRYFWYGLILTGLLLLFLAMPGDLFLWSDKLHFQLPHLHPHPFPHPRPPHHDDLFIIHQLRRLFFPFLMVVLLSIILKIQARLRKAEGQKVEAELMLLKAQINPHFLFNTLNSIYALALEKSDDTAAAVVRLSGLMRFATTEALKDRVEVARELAYISDYVELQLLRLGKTVEVFFEMENETQGQTIAPLILISFIENAFKHGIGPEGEGKIKIMIEASEKELHVQVSNQIFPLATALEWESSGMGVANTKERLQGIYPNRHELQIQNDGRNYEVNLKIQL